MTRTSEQKIKPVKKWLKVDSFADLMDHEKKIIEHIERTPNGGQLFLIHPFMLLEDIGVELSKRTIEEIQEKEPRLTALSPVPYLALKKSKAKQHVRFHVHGLFRRGEDA